MKYPNSYNLKAITKEAMEKVIEIISESLAIKVFETFNKQLFPSMYIKIQNIEKEDSRVE